MAYGGGEVPVFVLTDELAAELDLLFLATDAETSRAIVSGPGAGIGLIVDNSSAFRLDPSVPLVVPEANAAAARERPGNVLANPNCTTAAAVVALAPIRDLVGLESVDLASYQAVSGAGRAGLDAFLAERGSEDREIASGSPFHGRIADSVVPQIDVLDETGWTGEENKIHAELRKILGLPSLDVAATTVRVPVQTGHSVAIHFRTARPATVAQLEEALRAAPGVEYRPADGSSAIQCRSTSRGATRCSSDVCAPSRAASAASPSSCRATICARARPSTRSRWLPQRTRIVSPSCFPHPDDRTGTGDRDWRRLLPRP